MMKKRILFVNASLSNGGSERVMVLLANELCLRGYNITMIVLDNRKETYKPDKKINIVSPMLDKEKSKVLKKIHQIKFIRKEISTGKYDDIVSFMQEVNVLTLIASLGLKEKIIISERCNPLERKKNIWYYLSKILYNKSEKIVIQTEKVREMLFKNIRNKCYVIPNPVNKNIPDIYFGKREKIIVAAGRLTDQKNFYLLIDGFSEFSKIHKDYRLKIYGKGPLLNNLKKFSEAKGCLSKINFMGFTDNLCEEIKKSAMYISTSNYEGISNTMIEALAMGLPTICTDCPVGGASLMIQNEENGILIPVGDKQKLIYYMNMIVENKKFAKYISNNATKVRIDYSIKKITDKWDSIL